MNPTVARKLGIAAELLAIAVTVAVIVTAVMYALAAPEFMLPLGTSALRSLPLSSAPSDESCAGLAPTRSPLAARASIT